MLDAHLAGRDWVSGNSVTLADFVLATPLMYRDQAKLPVTNYQNIMRWQAQIEQLDIWQKTEFDWTSLEPVPV